MTHLSASGYGNRNKQMQFHSGSGQRSISIQAAVGRDGQTKCLESKPHDRDGRQLLMSESGKLMRAVRACRSEHVNVFAKPKSDSPGNSSLLGARLS